MFHRLAVAGVLVAFLCFNNYVSALEDLEQGVAEPLEDLVGLGSVNTLKEAVADQHEALDEDNEDEYNYEKFAQRELRKKKKKKRPSKKKNQNISESSEEDEKKKDKKKKPKDKKKKDKSKKKKGKDKKKKGKDKGKKDKKKKR